MNDIQTLNYAAKILRDKASAKLMAGDLPAWSLLTSLADKFDAEANATDRAIWEQGQQDMQADAFRLFKLIGELWQQNYKQQTSWLSPRI